MRRFLSVLLSALALATVAPFAAHAQQGASCPIGAQSPFTVALSTYTLSLDDECAVIIFSWSASPVAVTVPVANTLAPGYQVTIIAKTQDVVLTPVNGTINGSGSTTVSAGLSATLYSNGSAAYVTTGASGGTVGAMTRPADNAVLPIARNNLHALPTVSVSDYGAKCDNATNDTAAFVSAIAALPNGGMLGIPVGFCKVTSFSVPGSIRIVGTDRVASAIFTTSATENVITFTGPGSSVENLTMASTPTRTAGAYVYSSNGGTIQHVNMANYFVAANFTGVNSSTLSIGAALYDVVGFLPAIGAGSAFAIFENFSTARVDKLIVAGPASGTQPDYGLKIGLGDTMFITDSNITLHGNALAVVPIVNEYMAGLHVTSSVFDGAGTITGGGSANSCSIGAAGLVYAAQLTGVWCGLAAGDNLLVSVTGSGVVDGLQMTNMVLNGSTGGKGLNVSTEGIKNWSIKGGEACGNIGGGVYVGSSTQFMIDGVIAGQCGGTATANGRGGIGIGNGASDYYSITNNIVDGNTWYDLYDGGSGIHKNVGGNL